MAFVLMTGTVIAAEDNGNIITAIEVRGNEQVEKSDVLSVIETEVGDKVNNKQLKKDLQAVYDMGNFVDVRVNFENYLGGVKLIFEVVENPRLSEIVIKGNKIASNQDLRELLDSQTDKMLNTNSLNQDLRKVEAYYQEQGLILAYIEDVSISPEGVLTIIVNEGFLEDIKIKGNEKTRDYVIRRELDIEAGDAFDINEVREDLREIYNLGFFNDVRPKIQRTEDGSNGVDLLIDVDEKKTGQLQLGAGYSSKDGWLGYIEAKEKNLFGRAQQLGFKWEFGEVNNYELSFYDPWAFGEEFSFGADLYNRTNKNNTDSDKGDYTEVQSGGSVKVGKPLAEDIKGSLKFKYENTLTDWAKEEYEDQRGDTRSLIGSVVRDTTDNPMNPTRGARDMASIEYAGELLGGDYDFSKYNLEMRRYFQGFKDDHTWALRVKGGVSSSSNLPSHEEYRLGGSNTLRGFKKTMSGDKMALANVEYRFPIVKQLQGTVFMDAGQVWQDEGMQLEKPELKYSGGLGVRMNTPLGQIRVDYALGNSGEGAMPHFSIGQTF